MMVMSFAMLSFVSTTLSAEQTNAAETAEFEEDILKNRVNTISQFMVLKYLKSCLNTDMFHFYLIKL